MPLGQYCIYLAIRQDYLLPECPRYINQLCVRFTGLSLRNFKVHKNLDLSYKAFFLMFWKRKTTVFSLKKYRVG